MGITHTSTLIRSEPGVTSRVSLAGRRGSRLKTRSYLDYVPQAFQSFFFNPISSKVSLL